MADQVTQLLIKFSGDASNLKGTFDEVNRSTDQAGANFNKMGNIAAAGIAAVGVGLTAYAKSATDFTEQSYKDSQTLARNTGLSIEQASALTAVTTKLGLSTSNVTQEFGIFAKQISTATENTQKNAIAHQGLQIQIQETQKKLDESSSSLKQNQLQLANQIQTTKISIQQTTDQININGDASGALTAKVQGLQLKLQDLNKQYQDNTTNTGDAAIANEKLQNQLSSLKEQLNSNSTGFEKLGISVTDAAGKQKSFNDLLLEVADKFHTMPDGIDKTTIAMQLFGRQGKDMIKFLDLGSQGISDMEAQAEKLGLTLNANTVVRIQKLIESQKALKEQTDALKISVGTATAPVLTSFNRALNDVESKLIGMGGPLHSVTVGVLAFGGPVAGAASGLTAFAANIEQASGGTMNFAKVLANPYVLGAIAATAAGVGLYELWKHLHKSSQELTDSTITLDQSIHPFSSSVTTAANNVQALNTQLQQTQQGMTLTTLFTQAQKNAQDDLNSTKAQYQQILANQPAVDQQVQVAQQAASSAQAAYNQAVQQYGPYSDQASAAARILQGAQGDLAVALSTAAGQTLNVSNAQWALKGATDALTGSTQQLKTWNDLASGGWEHMATVVAQIGPTANNQIHPVALLVQNLQSVGNLKGNLDSVAGSANNAYMILQGANSLGSNLQNTVSNIKLQAGSLGSVLQGGTITIQGHRAAGGDVSAGSAYVVGESGQEIFIPQQAGTILPADQTRAALKGGNAATGNSYSITIAPNIGVYAGLPSEKRAIAVEIYKEIVREARAHGVQLPQIGSIPVQ